MSNLVGKNKPLIDIFSDDGKQPGIVRHLMHVLNMCNTSRRGIVLRALPLELQKSYFSRVARQIRQGNPDEETIAKRVMEFIIAYDVGMGDSGLSHRAYVLNNLPEDIRNAYLNELGKSLGSFPRSG